MQRLSTCSPAAVRRGGLVGAEADAPWKARAVAELAQHDGEELVTRLLRAVRAVIGQEVSPAQVWASPAEQAAALSVDGVRFRWEQGRLVLLRPCVHCGLGQLASPALHARADLGYALADWQPRHAGCEQDDPAEW